MADAVGLGPAHVSRSRAAYGLWLRAGATSRALTAYFVLAIVATWPLATGLARDVAWDLGDSLLNMWILSWDCEQILALLRGDVSRVATFFDANIFYPMPLTLAYSEHLLPQALQILPLYALTKNPILCYNLLFLSTIVLSGLGAYLLVRELTGSPLAGFVAGLLFAFAPYRLAQSPHLQVLSSQWMPFALYGLRRYFESRRMKPLLWAAVALAAQNLSCGYYLLYFAPFPVAYALWEMAGRHLLRDGRTWLHMLAGGSLTAALTLPVLVPYMELNQRLGMARSFNEVASYSADVYAYATGWITQPLWGRVMQAFPRAEGELFPGLIPVVLSLIAVAFGLMAAHQRVPGETGRTRRVAIWFLSLAAIAHLGLAFVVLLERRVRIDLAIVELRASNVTQLLLRAAIAFAAVLVLSPSARRRAAAFLRDRGFFVVALAAAVWLSLGPVPQTLGRPLELAAPYRWLFEHVPGFDGVRVPARFGMVVAFMLAVLGGYGAAALARWRAGRWLTAAMAAAFLLEGTMMPFVVNAIGTERGYNSLEPRVYRPARAPRIYTDAVRALPPGVLAELPLGMPGFDLRAVYYSTVHWRKILNGYSGYNPPHYGQLAFALSEIPRHPEVSLLALRAAGATHVLVHEGAYLGNEGEQTSAALRTLGASELFRDGSDVLFELPR
jgi:hypothetical protein